MNRSRLILSLLLFISLLSACEKENETVDKDPPTIDIGFEGAFPVQCSELVRGESFPVKVRLADNVALGSYSIDIHHNFNHHSHSTEVDGCQLEEKKDPVNPFKFVKTYDDIPPNSTAHETAVEIAVPEDIDPGDYHFMLMVTDQSGWSSMVGLSIKIK